MRVNLYMTVLNASDSLGNVIKSLQDVLTKLRINSSIYCYKNNRKDLLNVKQGFSFIFKLFSKGEIHWFQYPHYYSMLELLRFLKGIKIVEYQGVTPQRLWKYNAGKKLLLEAEKNRKILNYADFIITHSRFAYNELKKDLRRKIPNIILPISTDTKKFKPKKVKFSKYEEKYGISGKDIILLTVGRFSYNKRLPVQISAVKKVLPVLKNVKLLIVGNYNQEPYSKEYNSCTKLVKKLELTNSIKFLGIVSEEELIDLYNIADIYISSSLHEGFCMPIMEAMSSGTPVIGADAAAIPETIGSAGLIFKPDNVNDLAKKILLLARNKKLYNNLIKKGLVRSRKNNITSKMIKRLISKITQR